MSGFSRHRSASADPCAHHSAKSDSNSCRLKRGGHRASRTFAFGGRELGSSIRSSGWLSARDQLPRAGRTNGPSSALPFAGRATYALAAGISHFLLTLFPFVFLVPHCLPVLRGFLFLPLFARLACSVGIDTGCLMCQKRFPVFGNRARKTHG